ncbi:MAG: DUF4920 domain-containing protein [Pyrinomonadaceae bacterium]
MKKILGLIILSLTFTIGAFAQEKMDKMDKMDKQSPTEADKQAAFDASGMIKRGMPLSASAKKVSLAKAMKNPAKYAGKNVVVEGVIVRSCKMEGCWMELAPDKDSASIHIDMKNHSFFIPLNSAGYKAKAEGMISVKTLTKAQVDHMIEDDGAKFDKRNSDGSVTQVSFEATGVELKKS